MFHLTTHLAENLGNFLLCIFEFIPLVSFKFIHPTREILSRKFNGKHFAVSLIVFRAALKRTRSVGNVRFFPLNNDTTARVKSGRQAN